MSPSLSVPARLSLGPILFHWDAEAKRDFYFRIADEAPVDIVYLGEPVCSKRALFLEPHLPEIIERLRRAGKEVVVSTLALITSDREMAALGELTALPDLMVEVNDIGGVRLFRDRPHVIGPFVNVYNEGTLAYLAGCGMRRIVLVAEMPKASIATLASAAHDIELEIQAFGRLPLAVSARCYHARTHGLHKDGCQYVCGLDPNGLSVETLEGEGFLAINGVQTLSFTVCSLLAEVIELRRLGLDIFRLWPHELDMVAVAQLFRDVLDGREDPDAAEARLADWINWAPLSRTLYHGVGAG